MSCLLMRQRWEGIIQVSGIEAETEAGANRLGSAGNLGVPLATQADSKESPTESHDTYSCISIHRIAHP